MPTKNGLRIRKKIPINYFIDKSLENYHSNNPIET